jgi:hypothetical protein
MIFDNLKSQIEANGGNWADFVSNNDTELLFMMFGNTPTEFAAEVETATGLNSSQAQNLVTETEAVASPARS